jgi:cell filamentation protein
VNPYTHATTGIHHNKLGITDRKELASVEYMLTDLRIAQLKLQPIQGTFDLAHLRQVHHHIFQDLYAWAGKERTLNFSKVDPAQPGWKSTFAPHDQIPLIAKSITEDLKAWNNLKGLEWPVFANKLAMVYVKFNYMHPFPEGNGRSTQTLLSQLAQNAGHHLQFDKVSAMDWNKAAARSMPQTNVREPSLKRPQDTALIYRVFQEIAAPTPARDFKTEPGISAAPPSTPGRRGPGAER